MSDWINIDGLMQHIKSKLGISSFDYLLDSEKAIVSVIESEPSIDIVRCSECKHFFKYSDLPTRCVFHLSLVNADDFCSYGER